MIETSDVEYFPTAIVGAGCAGLTLAHELINSKDFPCILLDPQKFRPEHAFSFWDDGHPHLTLARSLARKTWSKWEIRRLRRPSKNLAVVLYTQLFHHLIMKTIF